MENHASILSDELGGLFAPETNRATSDIVVGALQQQLGWERFGEIVRVGHKRVSFSTTWRGWDCVVVFRFLAQVRTEVTFTGGYADQVFAEAELARLLDVRFLRASLGVWKGGGVTAQLGGYCTPDGPMKIVVTYPKLRKPRAPVVGADVRRPGISGGPDGQ